MNTRITVTLLCTTCNVEQQLLDEPLYMQETGSSNALRLAIHAFELKHISCVSTPCPRCQHPHRVKNPYYEWHTLTCKACGHEERLP